MAKFVEIITSSDEMVMFNTDHVVLVEPGSNNGCIITLNALKGGSSITISSSGTYDYIVNLIHPFVEGEGS